MSSEQTELLSHIIVSAFLVWLLPNFLLVILLSYLTYESPKARVLLSTVQKWINDQQGKVVHHKREDSIIEKISGHINTLRLLLEDKKYK